MKTEADEIIEDFPKPTNEAEEDFLEFFRALFEGTLVMTKLPEKEETFH